MQNAAMAEMGLDAVYLAFDVPPEELARELVRRLMRGEGDASVTVVRLEEEALEEAVRASEVLVNPTSVGMSPQADAAPAAPVTALHPRVFIYDLIYNPAETRLL